MKRTLESTLLDWKNRDIQIPLIIRGARQVGKSYLIETFGKNNFSSTVVVNFEYQPQLKSCFTTLNPFEIVSKLELLIKSTIKKGETLLFLDEIQECPEAIQSLRYFKEKMPELHVIAAGSLLEFALNEEHFSFPVGRVQFLYLKPLSFHEFLFNSGEEALLQEMANVSLQRPFDPVVHEHALKLFKTYFLVGGMPAAVHDFLKNHSFAEAQRAHSIILQTYRSDFGKYSTKAQHPYLQRFFDKAPHVVGQHFKYVEIDPDVRARDLKVALQQLSWAGIVQLVYETNASGLPLRAQVDDRKFKLLFLDIGLMQSAGQIDAGLVWEQDLLQIRAGALAEQIVGQELLAYAGPYDLDSLYFWKREKKNSTAEVDYVIQVDSKIFPVEVKAGKTGHLRSIQKFIEEKQSLLGIKISQAPLGIDKMILSVPFYLIEQIPRLVRDALKKQK